MKVDTSQTIGEIVATFPQLSRVFGRHGIDFCCGGKRALRDVSAELGLDPLALAAELDADLVRGVEKVSWVGASPAKLIDHIIETHHQFLWDELPALAPLVDKVAAVHGQRHPELIALRDLFHEFRAELEAHMNKEERVLFPMALRMADGNDEAASHCGGIHNPIRVMEMEHDQAGAILGKMRTLTGGYALPEGACNSYKGLFARLIKVEEDLMEHVLEENTILFPSLIALGKHTSD